MPTPDFTSLNRDNIVDFLADIVMRRGADSYLGEDVSMSEHMLQAARQAEEAGADEAIVVGALLHDIGHYTSEFPENAQDLGIDNRHDAAGAAVLAPYFPAAVVACVRGHVDAKRYLCATDEGYFDILSPASVLTLELQGGPMGAQELRNFAANPYLEAILQVRRWDEGAKVPAARTPPFEHYAPMIRRVVARHAADTEPGSARRRPSPAP